MFVDENEKLACSSFEAGIFFNQFVGFTGYDRVGNIQVTWPVGRFMFDCCFICRAVLWNYGWMILSKFFYFGVCMGMENHAIDQYISYWTVQLQSKLVGIEPRWPSTGGMVKSYPAEIMEIFSCEKLVNMQILLKLKWNRGIKKRKNEHFLRLRSKLDNSWLSK